MGTIMECLILTVILAVSQTPSPVPGKTADKPTGSSQGIQKQSTEKQKPTVTPVLINSTKSEVSQNTREQPSNTNTEKSVVVREPVAVTVHTSWWERFSVIFAGLLVAAAGIGAYFANLTLRTMQGQLESMNQQLAQMRSAGTQTDALITQATRQVDQITISAIAAKASADGLKMSERAWMISCSPNMSDSFAGQGACKRTYVCVLKNAGRTPAMITEIGFGIGKTDSFDQIPRDPIYSPIWRFNKIVVAPNDSLYLREEWLPTVFLSHEDLQAIRNNRLFIYGYGFVNYLDFFSKNDEDFRQTRFCHSGRTGDTYPCIEAPPNYHGIK